MDNFQCQNFDDNIKQEFCFVNVDLVIPEEKFKSDILFDNKTSNVQKKYMNSNENIEEPSTQIEVIKKYLI